MVRRKRLMSIYYKPLLYYPRLSIDHPKSLPFTDELAVVNANVEIILRKVMFHIYTTEYIDPKRNDYCISQALSSSLSCVSMNALIPHETMHYS